MEFTSGSVETILGLLDRLVSPKLSLHVLSCAEQGSLKYRPSEGELTGLLPDLLAGSLCSAMFNSVGEIRYGLLTCPRFNGQDLSQWMGTIEFEVEVWRPVWKKVLADHNISAACVGLEEGIDLTDSALTVTGFPWKAPSLLAGAIRHSDGSWELREPEP